ncbi:MAG: hypothetical protein ACRDB0_04975 [Paraclostridium sp.]
MNKGIRNIISVVSILVVSGTLGFTILVNKNHKLIMENSKLMNELENIKLDNEYLNKEVLELNRIIKLQVSPIEEPKEDMTEDITIKEENKTPKNGAQEVEKSNVNTNKHLEQSKPNKPSTKPIEPPKEEVGEPPTPPITPDIVPPPVDFEITIE